MNINTPNGEADQRENGNRGKLLFRWTFELVCEAGIAVKCPLSALAFC